MPVDRNRTSVLRQLAALQKMKLSELQEKWRDLYGSEPPNFGRKFMFQQLAYRVQELFYGGLKPEVKERLKQAADSDSNAKSPQNSTLRLGPGLSASGTNANTKSRLFPADLSIRGRSLNHLLPLRKKSLESTETGVSSLDCPPVQKPL